MLYLVLVVFILISHNVYGYSHEDLIALRERTRDMFTHAYDGYMKYAYPYDELRPLTCDGFDTWGSFSLTLVDALDTLAVLGNWSEFRKAVGYLLEHLDNTKDVNVSVFETNIRGKYLTISRSSVVGGLISAHLLSKKAGFYSGQGWPCSGPLLNKAEAFASKLLPAFDTPTGLPYGTVNLNLGGVPPREIDVTCVAGIGTFILEFGSLSRLTGDPRYERVAMRAMRSLWNYKSSIGLLGSHINITSGSWINTGSTIGSGVDSFFEYLVKGSILFRTPELDLMFREYKQSIEKYMRHGDWHFIVQKETGRTFQPFFQGLDAFWPGVLVSYTRDDHPSLVHHVATGDIDGALRHLTAYHEVWKKYGFIPEVYNPLTDTVDLQNSAYLLRPEFIESIYHVYRATKDPLLIKMGADVLTSIEKSARTKCGYASVADVHTHKLDNRMESFFLSETIKYLYLLFDEDNFINQLPGESPLEAVKMTSGQYCYPGSGGYVFNTEAHPIDPSALKCCDARWLREQDRIDWVEDGQSTEKSQLELVENLLEQFNPMVEIVQNGIDKVFDEAPLSIQRLLDDAGARNLSTSQLYCGPTDQYSIESLTDVRRFLNHLTNLPIEGVDNTVAELSSLSGKVDESKLLSCPYPEFHQRFTYGGQLATPLK